jgi:hypothetical protein
MHNAKCLEGALEYRYQEENVGVSLTDLTPPHNNIIIV